MRDANRQGFLNRVEDIRHAEKDVDRLLDAARLKRIESGKQAVPISLKICAILAIVAIMITIFLLAGEKERFPIFMMGSIFGIGGICLILFAGHGE